MPIPIQKLHEAQRPLKERILAFLQEHSEEAFSPMEILAYLQGYDQTTIGVLMIGMNAERQAMLLAPIKKVLDEAVRSQVLQSASYQSAVYYGMRPR
jgi:hypothetical protein